MVLRSLLLIMLSFGMACNSKQQVTFDEIPQATIFLPYQWDYVCEPTEKFPSCHASTIVELPDGGLMVAWYAGSEEGAKDVAVLVSRRDADSSEWSEPVVLADTPEKPEGNPVLWVTPENQLRLYYMTMERDGWETCQMKAIHSDDGGRTWSEPILLEPELGFMLRNKPICLMNGDIILPIYDERKWASLFWISSDKGQTWQKTENLLSEPGNIQPTVIQSADGSLFSLMRTGKRGGRLWQATSIDNGRTWTIPVQSQLRNPNAACDMVKLINGLVVLVFNDSKQGRANLNVAISKDEGKTWQANYFLETQSHKEFSYPAIIQTRDGKIHITYTFLRTHIKHVVLTPENFKL
ncbi:exo-alpha-sialidase [candidate division KSB1 bacterium]|nr:exo-alpha-sialidase [candidate division KSB1 bacterium]